MRQIGIFNGRVQICYAYGRFGWTRNGGKTWHGGIDLVGLDDKTIRMPFYKGQKISGKVTRARIVYNHNDKTWEWGWYVCVQLDANQTPDTVNFLYFCHCSKLLVTAGQKVSSGDALAIMGQTGNAANGYDHCHLEARATATGTGVDPTGYADVDNAVGIYGTTEESAENLLIDVSEHQGSIDWNKVPCRALVRIGYRGYGSGQLCKDECFAALAPAGYPLFFDTEWSHKEAHDGRADSLKYTQRTACARAFCERAEALGFQAGIYTSTSFACANVDYEGLCEKYIGWLADTRTNYDQTLPRYIHQYAQGAVDGVPGTVDLDRLVRPLPTMDKPADNNTAKLQIITIGPVSQGDANAVLALCKERGLTDQGLYKSVWA